MIAVQPPTEQGRIARLLDQRLRCIDTVIRPCQSDQESLREYPVRLIVDVAADKLDGRKVVATFPDEPGAVGDLASGDEGMTVSFDVIREEDED